MAGKGFLDHSYNLRDGDTTREHYDNWAATYDEELRLNNYSQPQRCAYSLSELGLHKGANIIDVGCGTGLAAVAISKLGYRNIDGCDYSAEMLKKAHQTEHYHRLFEADLNKPPMDVKNEQYDAALVVGVFSFGHVNAEAMDDILRVLKPGAPLVIGLNNAFYEEGSLTRKLQQLSRVGELTLIKEEVGDHLPGIDLSGWVLSLRKA